MLGPAGQLERSCPAQPAAPIARLREPTSPVLSNDVQLMSRRSQKHPLSGLALGHILSNSGGVNPIAIQLSARRIASVGTVSHWATRIIILHQ